LFHEICQPKFWQNRALKAGISGAIVLFSYTMGIDTGEHLCYVLNFNTSIFVIFQVIVAIVVESPGSVWHFSTTGGEQLGYDERKESRHHAGKTALNYQYRPGRRRGILQRNSRKNNLGL
jgi:hypothetical protein